MIPTIKIKEMIIDCRRKKTDILTLFMSGACMESLGFPVLQCGPNRLCFLMIVRENHLTQKLIASF